MNEHKQINPFDSFTQHGESTQAVRNERIAKRNKRHKEFLKGLIIKRLDCYTCSKFGMCRMLKCPRYANLQKERNAIIAEIRSEH